MPKGPSLTESNGIATLEGKLRLIDGTTGQSGNGDFESALTATACVKIVDFMFSGARIEALNFS